MTLRQYLFLMSLSSGACVLAWLLVIFNVDPEAGKTSLILFYLSFFLMVVGVYSTFGFIIRRFLSQTDEVAFRFVKRSFKQGATVAIFLTATALLLQFDLFNWLTGISLVVLFCLTEGLMFSNRKFTNNNYV